LHPGIWLYLDENVPNIDVVDDLDENNLANKKVCHSKEISQPMYVGLSFKGIKSKPMEYWQKFISNESLNSFEDLNTSKSSSHLGKFHKEEKIYIYTIPSSPYVKYMILGDSITIYINDIPLELKSIGIADILQKHLKENPPTVAMNIEDQREDYWFGLTTMNFEVEIGKIYSAFSFGIGFNFPSLDQVYKLYPVLETM
jgi:hypothetical protein